MFEVVSHLPVSPPDAIHMIPTLRGLLHFLHCEQSRNLLGLSMKLQYEVLYDDKTPQ